MCLGHITRARIYLGLSISIANDFDLCLSIEPKSKEGYGFFSRQKVLMKNGGSPHSVISVQAGLAEQSRVSKDIERLKETRLGSTLPDSSMCSGGLPHLEYPSRKADGSEIDD